MLRTALQPRWLALLALVVGLIAGFVTLGRWQLAVAQEKAVAEATAAQHDGWAGPATPVRDLLPGTQFPVAVAARKVSASGAYRAGDQLLVADRTQDGRAGYWILSAFVTGEGRVLPVLRGFVERPEAAPPAPTGQLTVVGVLAPGDPTPDRPRQMPAGQVQNVSIATLVNRWTGEFYPGVVYALSEEPTPVPAVLRIPPPPVTTGGLNWRNLAYAVQWWFFAAFALYMWARMVREDHRRTTPPADPPSAAGPGPEPDARSVLPEGEPVP